MKKFWKIILTVAAILAAVVLGTGWYLSIHWKGLMDKELRRYVSEGSDSLYTLAYGKISLNLLTGSVGIENVALLPDSVVYARLVAEQRAPQVIYNTNARRVRVSGLKIWRYFIGKEVDAGAFTLTDPEITIVQDLRSRDTTPKRSFYASINEQIHNFSIGRIDLSNTRLSYIQIREDSSRKITKLENLDVQLRDLQIDSLTEKDLNRVLYAQNFDITLQKWDYRTPDSLYWLHVKNISYNAVERALEVESLELEPRYNKADFDKKIVTQNDRFELTLNHIKGEGIRLEDLLQQAFFIKKASIDGGELHAYRNRNLPYPPGDKYGGFPNQLLDKLQLPLTIDTLKAQGIHITYSELSPQTGETGKIEFHQAGGTFTHITNQDSLVKANNHCTVDLHAILMRTGKLKARFDFILGDKSGAFGVSGQLRDMDGREMNPATKPLGEVSIRSVNIHEMDFEFRGNEKYCSGTLKLLYDDLKIDFLKDMKDNKGKKRKKGLVSFIANLMALHNENPTPDRPVRIAKPRFTRDPKKSFFNLVWKTIFTGIKETVLTDAASGLM
ncbi:hypothetical protein [Chitinophaga barathri]|uniref:DUF748 domain-containing protein n=1 Tax=Chitinophaga barathri TaxID=1647451 RepID=A0A3N4M8X7_9BACT|nr:hypothetical protein [Chitinophaga barathri]RPD40124.1 hypothetical protein EG028_15825 [Chitinophaga barathri]